MSIPILTTFVDGVTAVTASWLNRMQQILASHVGNAKYSISGAVFTLPGGTGQAAFTVNINGKLRYSESPKQITFTGGDSNGVYGIFAKIQGDADPGFSITKVADPGVPGVSDYILLCRVSWNGTALSNLEAVLDYMQHGGNHRIGGPDEIPGLSTALSGAIPSGFYGPFGGGTVPAGWLLCNGQAVSRTTYSALFSAISTSYGAGDGSTTFNVPDMRGRTFLGKDDMGGSAANRVVASYADSLGGSGGAETVTLSAAEIPAHTHTGGAHTHDTPAHSHTISSSGAHQHDVVIDGTQWNNQPPTSGGLRFIYDGSSIFPASIHFLTTTDAGVSGAHTHTTTSGGAGTTTSAGAVATSSVGGGGAHSNMQPVLTCNVIIKT